jgi:hypothetical protein
MSSYLVVASRGGGDLGPLKYPAARHVLTVKPDARIFTINDPGDWHLLCATYPSTDEGGLFGGLLVPDYEKVAEHWDGVHISFGGLLASEQVQVNGLEGRTELLEANAEHTKWLRWVFEDVSRLPDLESPPDFTLWQN